MQAKKHTTTTATTTTAGTKQTQKNKPKTANTHSSSHFCYDDEPNGIVAYRKLLSNYTLLKRDGGYERAMQIKQKNPWITKLATSTSEHFTVEDDIPQNYPLHNKHAEKGFIGDILYHFHAHKLERYFENRWKEETVLSPMTNGVLRANVFNSKSKEELQRNVDIMIEFKTVRTLREWIIEKARMPNFNCDTCMTTRKFFWCMIHFHITLGADFNEAARCNRRYLSQPWFTSAYRQLTTSSSFTSSELETLNVRVSECHRIEKERGALLHRHQQLVNQLRERILEVRLSKREIRIIHAMLKELHECHEIRMLQQGMPIPPFDSKVPRAMLERVEREMAIMDFVANDMVKILTLGLPPVNSPLTEPAICLNANHLNFDPTEFVQLVETTTSMVMATQNNYRMYSKVANIVGHSCRGRGGGGEDYCDQWNQTSVKKAAPSQYEVLRLSVQVKADLQSIHQQTAECTWEFYNLLLQEAQRTRTEVKHIEHGIIQAKMALQTEQYDQHRRAVRREVKRIREARETAIVQMLPFATEQLKARAVHEQRVRAKAVEKQVHALLKAAARLEERIGRAREDEAALLAEHTTRERRRAFLAAAPHYLPIAMFEPDIECGICLENLQWHSDPGIRFVTCCPEYGYTCGACVRKPHPHPMVSEQEIVRIVRTVRLGMGV